MKPACSRGQKVPPPALPPGAVTQGLLSLHEGACRVHRVPPSHSSPGRGGDVQSERLESKKPALAEPPSSLASLLLKHTPTLTAAGGIISQHDPSGTASSAAFSSTGVTGPASGPVPLPAAAHLSGINSSAESLIAWPGCQLPSHPSRDQLSRESNPGHHGRTTLSSTVPNPFCFTPALCTKGVSQDPWQPQNTEKSKGSSSTSPGDGALPGVPSQCQECEHEGIGCRSKTPNAPVSMHCFLDE